MTDHITPCLLRFQAARWRLGGSFHGGGESIFGESQTRRSDGGGRWFCEIGPIVLAKRAEIQVFESLLLDWNNGNEKVIVHRWAGKLAVTSGGGALVPFSDGTTFSDGTEFVSGEVNAELLADAAHRATTISVRVYGAPAFQGGHPFTITGPIHGDRLYGVARILSAAEGATYTDYSLRISPPLREAATAGTHVDFDRPRCTMRVEVSNDEMWPTYGASFQSEARLRFSETFKP